MYYFHCWFWLFLLTVSLAPGAEPSLRIGSGTGRRFTPEQATFGRRVQQRIATKLQEEFKTDLIFTINVRGWIGADGRFTRLQIDTGNPDTDGILTNMLQSLNFAPIPADMPMPVTLRLRASRPAK